MKRPAIILMAATCLAAPATANEVSVPDFVIVNVETCALDQVKSVAARCGAVDYRIQIDENLIEANPTILEYAVADENGTLWLPPWHVIALEVVQ